MTMPELSADEADYVDRCAAFATDVIAPLHRRFDDDNAFPEPIHAAAFERGLLNAAIPRAHGGHGLSHLALARGGRLMARVCAPTTFTMGFNHGSLRPILWAGTSAQQARFIKPLVERRGYASWCMTEKDISGSNLMAVTTRAERTQSGWVITGEKCMTGNGAVAGLFLCLADAWDHGTRLGPTVFAVDKHGPGGDVVVGDNIDKLGFRCLTTVDVSFRGVAVDDGCVIGEVGDGLRVLVDSLDFMRFGGGIVILGLVEGALLDLMPWLESREVYGGLRLVDDSHLQVVLGRLVAEAIALEGLLERVARGLDNGVPVSSEANALKLLGADLALRATAEVMQAWGWRGIDNAYGAQKRFRDARQTSIYEGTSEVLARNQFRIFLREWRAAHADTSSTERP